MLGPHFIPCLALPNQHAMNPGYSLDINLVCGETVVLEYDHSLTILVNNG
jgi:hypothetical protein